MFGGRIRLTSRKPIVSPVTGRMPTVFEADSANTMETNRVAADPEILPRRGRECPGRPRQSMCEGRSRPRTTSSLIEAGGSAARWAGLVDGVPEQSPGRCRTCQSLIDAGSGPGNRHRWFAGSGYSRSERAGRAGARRQTRGDPRAAGGGRIARGFRGAARIDVVAVLGSRSHVAYPDRAADRPEGIDRRSW